MLYRVYILKTLVYRTSVCAETRQEAEDKLTKDIEENQFQLLDNWWDFDSIEAEEELYPEELAPGFDIEADRDE